LAALIAHVTQRGVGDEGKRDCKWELNEESESFGQTRIA